ncbi:MAG UNVERIFIED_CONTAM: hypothetical protein LVT10_19345 [Anaerolineae bacterium]
MRGQNHEQGRSDSRGLPNVFTAYQPVTTPEVRAKFEQVWHTDTLGRPRIDRNRNGRRRAPWVTFKAMVVRMGGNPLMSEPNSVARAYTPLSACSLLVCIDIFMNETGQLADVTRPV